MHKTNKKYKDREYTYLRCRLWINATHAPLCSSHRISFDDLKSIVAERIKEHIQTYCESTADIMKMTETMCAVRDGSIANELKMIEARIQKQSDIIKQLYMDKFSGVITEQEFIQLKETFSLENSETAKRKEILLKEKEEAQDVAQTYNNKLALCDQYRNFAELDREIVDEFVDYIEVGEAKDGNQDVIIHWTF